MIEALASKGHSLEDLLDSSLDKLLVLWALSGKREARERNREDLRTLRITRAAVVSVLNSKGFQAYRSVERELERAAGEVYTEDQTKGLPHLIQRLRKMGAQNG